MLTRAGRVHSVHSVKLRGDRSGCRKQNLSLDGPSVTSPPVPVSRARTVIFDIVEYIIMEWTMPNESRICRLRICRSWAGSCIYIFFRISTWAGSCSCISRLLHRLQEPAQVLILKKKKSVAGQFAAVKYRSEPYSGLKN